MLDMSTVPQATAVAGVAHDGGRRDQYQRRPGDKGCPPEQYDESIG